MIKKVIIKSAGTISIDKNTANVFDFYANPSNDNLWRKEINQSTLNGTFQTGVAISEYSYLSKKAPNNLIELKCIEYHKNQLATFETPENARFYVKSNRQVRQLSNNKTEVKYTIDFDIEIVKFALGFALPKFMVSMKASIDLKKYLRQLKVTIESM